MAEQLCPCGLVGSQALADLGNPFFSLSLLGQRPALQDSPLPTRLRKSVLVREGDQLPLPALGQSASLGGTDGAWQQRPRQQPS